MYDYVRKFEFKSLSLEDLEQLVIYLKFINNDENLKLIIDKYYLEDDYFYNTFQKKTSERHLKEDADRLDKFEKMTTFKKISYNLKNKERPIKKMLELIKERTPVNKEIYEKSSMNLTSLLSLRTGLDNKRKKDSTGIMSTIFSTIEKIMSDEFVKFNKDDYDVFTILYYTGLSEQSTLTDDKSDKDTKFEECKHNNLDMIEELEEIINSKRNKSK